VNPNANAAVSYGYSWRTASPLTQDPIAGASCANAGAGLIMGASQTGSLTDAGTSPEDASAAQSITAACLVAGPYRYQLYAWAQGAASGLGAPAQTQSFVMPPQMSTSAASGESDTGATLHGQASLQSGPTGVVVPAMPGYTYAFELGADSSYGQSIPASDKGAGASARRPAA
jgi:hypothetical protein